MAAKNQEANLDLAHQRLLPSTVKPRPQGPVSWTLWPAVATTSTQFPQSNKNLPLNHRTKGEEVGRQGSKRGFPTSLGSSRACGLPLRPVINPYAPPAAE